MNIVNAFLQQRLCQLRLVNYVGSDSVLGSPFRPLFKDYGTRATKDSVHLPRSVLARRSNAPARISPLSETHSRTPPARHDP